MTDTPRTVTEADAGGTKREKDARRWDHGSTRQDHVRAAERESVMGDLVVIATTACPDCAHETHYPVTCQRIVTAHRRTGSGALESTIASCGCNGGAR